MPSKGFDTNAYGNPRAQVQPKETAATHEPVEGSSLNNGTAYPLVAPPSQIPALEAPATRRWPSPSNNSPLQSADLASSIEPETARVCAQHTRTPTLKQPTSNLTTKRSKRTTEDQPQLAHFEGSVGTGKPSTISIIDDKLGEAVNKLDLEPKHVEESGIPLSRIDPHLVVPKTLQTNGKMNVEAQLRQLQDVALKQITRRGKTRQLYDEKRNTTSLKDLDLARTPVNPNKPSISRRLWAEGSPVTEGKEGEEYTGHRNKHAIPSQTPEAPSHQISPSTYPADTIDAASLTPQTFVGADQPHDTTDVPVFKGRNAIQKRSKWATKEEVMAPEKEEVNSNAWGSGAPSDETRSSNVSDKQFGRLLNPKPDVPEETTIADWDGKFLPAPADWDDRPRFNNNNLVFKAEFQKWLPYWIEVGGKSERFSNGIPFLVISQQELQNLDNHADGISMVERTTTINFHNANYYGYTDDPEGAIRYSKPTDEDEYGSWGKLDPSDPDNVKHGDETCQDLINNWMAHLAVTRAESATLGYTAPKKPLTEPAETASDVIGMTRTRPKLNIYLRPVTDADLSELTRIYNWYVTNSTRPAETQTITESDMVHRLEVACEGRIPFIVAAKKSQKRAPAVHDDDGETELDHETNVFVKHRKQRAVTRIEQLAGYCCAQDFTTPDFVEHISAELEVFVDSRYKGMGVGRCLMDKMLEICDRAHIRQTECAFHCDQSIRHQYNPGGDRELHKLFILVRKWHTPKAATITLGNGKRVKNNALGRTDENEWDRWQKAWFERLGFEVEATLKKAGAKHGRYLDVVYVTRETSWAPEEGQVPEPLPCFVRNNGVSNDDEEDDGY